MLQPKDEIIVPFDQQLTVFVYGEVKTRELSSSWNLKR